MNRHRMSDLLGSLRRLPDPARWPHPVVRALVAQLGTVVLPAPRPRFRRELRAQLVAIAPRLVSEGAPASTHPISVQTAVRRRWLPHPLRVAAGLVVTAALLFGLGLWASQRALPGDALYSLKRGWESARLAFTHGTDRGTTYLHYASRRVDEVSGLLSRASASGSGAVSDGLSSHTMSLIDSTLDAADTDMREGTRILTDQASNQRSGEPLQILISWAPKQLSTLHAIEGRLPVGAARNRVLHSISVVHDSAARAQVLAPLAECGCFHTLPSDSGGPIPPAGSPAGAPGSSSESASPGASSTSPTVPGSTDPNGTATSGTASESTSAGDPPSEDTGSPTDSTTEPPTVSAVPVPTTSAADLPTSSDLPTGSDLPSGSDLPTSTSLPPQASTLQIPTRLPAHLHIG
jgi:hypothetical protein